MKQATQLPKAPANILIDDITGEIIERIPVAETGKGQSVIVEPGFYKRLVKRSGFNRRAVWFGVRPIPASHYDGV